MTLPKLKRKAKGIWRKSVKRLGFDVAKKIAVVVLLTGLNFYWLSLVGQTNSYFSDTETGQAEMTAGIWMPELLSPLDGAVINGSYVEQRWTPINDATKYIYQSCNNDPDTDPVGSDGCNLRWYEEYGPSTPQFAGAKKWANNVANATYWWRVKVQIGAFTSQWTPAWEIVIDNSHPAGVVINEFLPNPAGEEYGFNFGEDGDDMPKGEWVELYNNDSVAHDLSGWYIKDLANHIKPITLSNTQPVATLIEPNSWLVVYMNQAILNNTDPETIYLFNDSDVLMDQYSYSGNDNCDLEPTPGEENANNPSGNCSGVPGNKSYARVPDGSVNWVDPIPTPGKPNVLENQEPIVNLVEINQKASPSFSETLESATGAITEFVLGEEDTAASTSEGFENVASGSAESEATSTPEPSASPEAMPEVSPEVTPEPTATPEPTETPQLLDPADSPQAGDDSSIQAPTEPAIPAEPVTVEPPAEPAPPPADPPAPAPDPMPAPAPDPAPAPAE